MLERATHETLAKDLYTLTGQVHAYGGQMDELRDLLNSGFHEIKTDIKKLDTKLDDRVDQLDARIRTTENIHAGQQGAHGVIGWFAGSIVVLASGALSWILSHIR